MENAIAENLVLVFGLALMTFSGIYFLRAFQTGRWTVQRLLAAAVLFLFGVVVVGVALGNL